MRALQLLLGGLCGAAAPFSAPRLSPDTDALHYNLGKTATPHTGRCGTPDKPAACPPVTVNRTLTDRLADQISVLDFGATASCHGDTLATCQHDSTQAFVDAVLYAGGEDSSPFDFQTVVVPPGWYRIDGTITITGQWLVVQKGARLLRKSCATNNTAPIVRLTGSHGRVTGGGVLSSENLSPRGVLNIGPANLSDYTNVGSNTVEGLSIAGAAQRPECTGRHDGPVECTGVHMDSSQPLAGGSCYSNVVRNVQISGTDAGVYLGNWVNANHLTSVMMGGLGRYSYLFENNTENSVFGGFTTGAGAGQVPHTVIVGRASGYNWFISVQAEPGAGSTYFDFDNRSEANAGAHITQWTSPPHSLLCVSVLPCADSCLSTVLMQ